MLRSFALRAGYFELSICFSCSSVFTLVFVSVPCQDNGMGMAHEKIPRMLGVVLSSTKYGVRQSRGKFGLGAKMVNAHSQTLQICCMNL